MAVRLQLISGEVKECRTWHDHVVCCEPVIIRYLVGNVGNIRSASKELGYVAKEHIRPDIGETQDGICLLKGAKVTGIRGEFTTNFAIPELMGLGKSVSRGFGAVTRLK